MVGLVDVLMNEIETHHGHYQNYITGDWKKGLYDYKLYKKFNSDIVDLLLHVLVNSTSTSCYIVHVDEEVKIDAIHPARSSVVAEKEIFIAKIGQHYDAIVEDKPPVVPLVRIMTYDHIGNASPPDAQLIVHSPNARAGRGNKRNEEKRRMKKITSLQWDGLPVKKTDALPYDIDGNCIYQLSYDKNDRLSSSKDGRPWKKGITSNTKEFRNGTRKIAKCKGSCECTSPDCMFRKEYGKNNTVNFDVASADCATCRICKQKLIFMHVPLLKSGNFMIIMLW